MYLQPSDICFSQDSIGSTFGRCTSHPFKPIGETLDDILTGTINVNSIPSISVCKKDGKWFTADNRRLWVLQEAEKRGKCSEVYVQKTSYINYNKFTTVNNGTSVYVRGNPGGYLWRSKPIMKIKQKQTPKTKAMPFAKPFLTSGSDICQNLNKEMKTPEIWSAKIESNVQPFNECPMSKSKEGLCFEQEVHEDDEEVVVDIGKQKCMGIDSESETKDVQQPEDSSNFEILQQQNIVNAMNQVYDSTEDRKIEIEIEAKREENIKDEKETQDIEEVVINVSNIPNTHTNGAFLNLNSEELAQVENMSAVVTISEETQSKATKSTNTKRCNFICVIISIAILFAILCLIGIVLGINLT